MRPERTPPKMPMGGAAEVLRVFARLGCTSFGGPVAHIGIFRGEFVTRRAWLDEAGFADLVALCQFLPGPASSQLGMAIGLLRAGPLGMLFAWTGFTLPSAAVMVVAAYGIGWLGNLAQAGWLHGLKLVAVAVVAQAVWGMARSLCPDRARASLAVIGALLALAEPNTAGQVGAIFIGGLAGVFVLPRPRSAEADERPSPWHAPVAPRVAATLLVLFLALLIGTPLLTSATTAGGPAKMFSAFYRAGALVFGGGHVVLPLLQDAVVPNGWVDQGSFLAGYGVAQAVPGPLFTFAAYLGAAKTSAPNGIVGAAIALIAIFLPSFLLVAGALPAWSALRRFAAAQAALRGINAAVVGLLAAALYTPVWTNAVFRPADFGVVLAAFLLLAGWSVPPWMVVVLGAAVGWAIG